ncbi:DUF397 domain-containing protein [Streptomyces sp. ISL-43]|uniref:DUF397 domain-containing protein n=1 Tax=Streptomyces sp. ISL-43 TaxID=2819183 RepID=UPI001BE99701|nr:DUF397 domain-containing protein [Streptomyces sp. ISL-43]MBT2446273.1 DUF397 domain-containing protein [Streptomyces sp. ISL-43]
MAYSGTDLSNAVWRTSTYTNGEGGDCVEVADGVIGLVPVRDSKRRSGPVLVVSAAAWAPFVAGLKSH